MHKFTSFECCHFQYHDLNLFMYEYANQKLYYFLWPFSNNLNNFLTFSWIYSDWTQNVESLIINHNYCDCLKKKNIDIEHELNNFQSENIHLVYLNLTSINLMEKLDTLQYVPILYLSPELYLNLISLHIKYVIKKLSKNILSQNMYKHILFYHF